MAQTKAPSHNKPRPSVVPVFLQKIVQRIFPFIVLTSVIIIGLPGFIIALVQSPKTLTSLDKTRETFFGVAFPLVAPLLDWLFRPYKLPVLSQAHGIVLDVGSGTGTNVHHLDPAKITKLILVEPNRGMFPGLRKNLKRAGFKEGQYVICECGAEEEEKVLAIAGIKKGDVDTVVSVFALCSIPNPQKVIASLYSYLKPGTGKFIFFEHCQSHEPSTSAYQRKLTPLWSFIMYGCDLARPTDKWITEPFEYSEVDVGGVPTESPFAFDPKRFGIATKA